MILSKKMIYIWKNKLDYGAVCIVRSLGDVESLPCYVKALEFVATKIREQTFLFHIITNVR